MGRIHNSYIDDLRYIYARIANQAVRVTNFKENKKMLSKLILYLVNLVVIWMTPIKGALIFVLLLVMVDTITGIMKAGKSNVDKIQSKKAFKLVPKVFFYLLLVIVAQAVNNYVDGQIPWVKLALVGIGWIEIKSIDENFKEMFGFSFINKALEGFKKLTNIERK